MLQQVITSLTMVVSLLTAGGVVMHDTNIDKALVSAMVKIAAVVDGTMTDDASKIKPGSTPHTHPEHTSISSIMREGNARPRSTPRNTDRKHLQTKRAHGGGHEFDGNRLTIDPIMA